MSKSEGPRHHHRGYLAAIGKSVIDPGEKTGENFNVGKQADAG